MLFKMALKRKYIHLAVFFVLHQFLVAGFIFGSQEEALLPNDPARCVSENITFVCTNEMAGSSIVFLVSSKNDTRVNETSVIVNATSKSLTLSNLTMLDHHASVYCCLDSCDEIGNIIGTQALRVYEYPVHVTNFFCAVHDWENIAQCRWSLGQNYTELPAVKVKWRFPSYSGSWNDLSDSEASEVWCNITLRPVSERLVDVQITVTSDCGVSVVDSFTFNASNIVKPGPIKNLTLSPLNSTCLNVSWSNPRTAFPKQYLIEYTSRWPDDTKQVYIKETLETKNTINYEHHFCGLTPNTEYKVVSKARPLIGGYWSEEREAEAVTLQDVPYSSPAVTDGSYRWDPTKCETEKRRTIFGYFKPIPERDWNAPLKAVVVEIDPPFHPSPDVDSKFEVPADHMQFTVEVDCATAYHIKIWLRNNVGLSQQASEMYIPKANPDLKIPELVIETGNNNVYLNWSSEGTGQATGFTAFWCKRDRGNCQKNSSISWKKFTGSTYTATIYLPSPEDYLYAVSMETEYGSTGLTWESCIYAMDAVPEKNPDAPTVSRSSEDNALSVSWNRIECESGSPYIEAYRVIYCVMDQADDNCTRDYIEEMVPSSQTSMVLHGLEEDVSYGVMIQGVTADGQKGPSSEPAFGTPLNRSLKKGSIAGIAVGSVFGVIFIIAGVIAIVRYCNRKMKATMKLPPIDIPPIDDIIKEHKLPNGFQNKGYSGSDGSLHPANGEIIGRVPGPPLPERIPPLSTPERAERQNSDDSGIPEDPLTPQPMGNSVFLDSDTDSAHTMTPEEIKAESERHLLQPVLPADYVRWGNEREISPNISKQMPQIIPLQNTIVMNVSQPPSPAHSKGNTHFGKKREDSLNNRDDEKNNTDSSGSYVKATVANANQDMHTGDLIKAGKDIEHDKEKVRMIAKHESSCPNNTDYQPIETVANNRFISEELTHTKNKLNIDTLNINPDGHPKRAVTAISPANTSDHVSHPAVSPSKISDHVSHPPSSTAYTSDYVSHPAVSPAKISDHVSHPPTSNANTSSHVSHPPVSKASTSDYVSHPPVPPNSSDYVSHPPVSPNSSDYESHPPVSPNSCDYESHPPVSPNSSGYVPHPPVSPNSSGYVPHPPLSPNSSDYVSHPPVSPNSSDYESHPPVSSANSSDYAPHPPVPSANTSGFVPHPPVSSVNSSGYVPHPTVTPNTSDYVSHPPVSSANTSHYVPHPPVSSANTSSYVPHPPVSSANTSGYVPHPPVSSANTSDYVPHPPVSSAKSSDYVSHPPTSTASSSGYLSHPPTSTANTSDYVSHPPVASANSSEDVPHPPVSLLNTSDYVSHPPTSTANTSGYVSHPPTSTASSSGYVSHPPVASANSSEDVPHPPVSLLNTSDYVSHPPTSTANTSGYVSHPPTSTASSSSYVSHPPTSAAISSDYVSHPPTSTANSNGYVSHPPTSTANTSDYVSHPPTSTASSNGYVSHPPTSTANSNGYVSHPPTSTANTSDYVSHPPTSAANSSGYVSHPPTSTASSSGYVSHPPTSTASSSGYVSHPPTSTANTSDYVSHPPTSTASSSGYVSHPPTSTASSSGYVSHPPTSTASSSGYVSHPPTSTANSNGYVSHPPTSTANTSDYVSHPPTSTASSSGYVSHPPTSTASSSGYVSHPPTSTASSSGYVSHPPTSTASSSGYVSHPPTSTANSNGYISHPPTSAANTSGYISHPPTSAANSSSYVPHPPTSTANSSGYISHPPTSSANTS